MNTTPDWNDLKAAGEVPPASPEVLAHARRQLEAAARPRPASRRLVPVLAAAGAVVAVAGGIAVHQAGSGSAPVGTSTLPTLPTRPTTTPPTTKPTKGTAASCAFAYSPAELKKRAFAFDGTVLKIENDPDGMNYRLTMRVEEWFKPAGGGRIVMVKTITPPQGSGTQVSVEFPDYTVGSRLLITGEPQWGGSDPLKDAIAWGCGFSRAYDAADAATWRKLVK